MKLAIALGSVLALLAAEPALAASSYPGEDVTVNPAALGTGYLLYPGGKYGRHVGQLLQPGEKPGQTIHLHMPRKVVHLKPRKVASPAALPSLTATAPAPVATQPPVTKPAPPPKRVASTPPPAAATPPAAGAAAPDLNSLASNSAAVLVAPAATPAPAPAAATPTPPPARKPIRRGGRALQPLGGGMPMPGGAAAIASQVASGPAPAQTASVTPPPAATAPADTGGLKKQTMIAFAAGSSTPGADDINAIHGLAGRLSTALMGGATKIQILAYGGPRGDKSSDSRRLSLKRALVIRELLIEDGVPSEKIDVRAMGGADDNGAADRVDIFLRS